MSDEVDTAELQREFREHLEEASQAVSAWPTWKQSILGRALGGSEEVSSTTNQHQECAEPLSVEE